MRGQPPSTAEDDERPSASAADEDAAAEVCLDCGAPRLGDYCHACGQHHADDRLTIRSVWRDFAERYLKLERGLSATARRAVLDVGGLAQDYVRGQRRRYVNPVSFLLIGSAIAVLLIPLYASTERLLNDPRMSPETQTDQANLGIDIGARIFGEDPSKITPEERARIAAESAERMGEFVPAYLSTVSQLYSVFSVILALAFAGLLKLFFSGRPRTYTYVETLVLGLFFAGSYTALSAVVASAVAQVGGTVNVGLAATTALLIVGAAWAAAGFYGRTWGNAALGALSGLVAFVVYLVSVMVIALPVVVVKML